MCQGRSRTIRLRQPKLNMVSNHTLAGRGRFTLKIAFFLLGIARKGYLRFLLLQLVDDLPVGDIAHLVVLFHDDALLVANAILPLRHQGIACIVCLTNIAVNAAPALCTVARIPFSHRPILALSEGATQGFGAVIAPKSSWARTFSVVFVAAPILCALKSL